MRNASLSHSNALMAKLLAQTLLFKSVTANKKSNFSPPGGTQSLSTTIFGVMIEESVTFLHLKNKTSVHLMYRFAARGR